MSTTSTVTRVGAPEPGPSGPLPPHQAAAVVAQVVAESAAADGAAPLDEAATLALRHRGLEGTALWVTTARDGFAWLHDGALDVAVAPGSRGAGLGRALVETATAATAEPLTAWSHGDHPAAAALAARFGFERARDLWVMRRPLTDLPELPAATDGVVVRPFEVGRDEDAWLAVNAAAFAHHPEQGRTTRADLDERIAEPWFDPAGFFLAWRGEERRELVGFHWTKVHAAGSEQPGQPAYGEVYVVGVAPGAQGGGLGKRLTLTGLHHLATLGLNEVLLYVEADNAPAVAVYERLGFTHAPRDTHVQYARS